jgi:hypothetical protein
MHADVGGQKGNFRVSFQERNCFIRIGGFQNLKACLCGKHSQERVIVDDQEAHGSFGRHVNSNIQEWRRLPADSD